MTQLATKRPSARYKPPTLVALENERLARAEERRRERAAFEAVVLDLFDPAIELYSVQVAELCRCDVWLAKSALERLRERNELTSRVIGSVVSGNGRRMYRRMETL